MTAASPAWSALRSRAFRLLAAGQFVSNIGDGMYAVALPWYVLSQHGSSVLLGTVLAAYGIPRTLSLMVGGHLSDRFGPVRVMLVADAVRTVLAVVLAVIAAGARPGVAWLVPVAFGLGAGEGLFLPASFAVLPAVLDDSRLRSGNALLYSGAQLASFTGPAVGGFIVAVTGSATGFGIDAATFAVSALTLWRLAAVGRSGRGEETGAATAAGPSGAVEAAGASGAVRAAGASGAVRAAAASGGTGSAGTTPEGLAGAGARPRLWAFCRSQPVFLLLLGVTLAANLGGAGADEVALPVFARSTLHTAAGGFGILVACIGAGSLAGSLASARISGGRRPATAAGRAFCIQALLLAAIALVVQLPLAAVLLAGFGLCNGFGNVIMRTLLQQWAPRQLLGRLMGMILTMSFGVFPVSVAAAGLVVHRFGAPVFFVAAGGILLLAIAVALSHPAFRTFGAPAAEPTP
jgi:MFS family permease